jgi:hypothetical protein
MPGLFIAKIHLAGCNPRSEIYNLRSFTGVLAQLVERLNGIEEVTGSNPVGSTTFLQWNGRQLQSFHDGFMIKRRARILFDCRTANDPIDRVDGLGVGVRNTDFESSSVSKMTV